MAVHEDLAVGYHQQDTDYYCGGGAPKWFLRRLVPASSTKQVCMPTITATARRRAAGTRPDGLSWTLNDRRPAGGRTRRSRG
jgi:hypothetical protein